jgi:hypothetical protein
MFTDDQKIEEHHLTKENLRLLRARAERARQCNKLIGKLQ